MSKIGRNEPCPCGSGKKYKHCCKDKDDAKSRNVSSSLHDQKVDEFKTIIKAGDWFVKHCNCLDKYTEPFFGDVNLYKESIRSDDEIVIFTKTCFYEWIFSLPKTDIDYAIKEPVPTVIGANSFPEKGSAYLKLLPNTHFSMYEILDSTPEILRVRDCIRQGNQEYVLKMTTSQLFEVGKFGVLRVLHDGSDLRYAHGYVPLLENTAEMTEKLYMHIRKREQEVGHEVWSDVDLLLVRLFIPGVRPAVESFLNK